MSSATKFPVLLRLLAMTLAIVVVYPTIRQAGAQGRTVESRRIATTVAALATYPVFFHTHTVRVRGTLSVSNDDIALEQGHATILLVGRGAAGLSHDAAKTREVLGRFLDVGRLTENDPRLSDIDIEQLSRRRLGKPWPGVNELLLLVVDSVEPAESFPAVSVRALALAPDSYLDGRVTVTGRFRGRNLYGDQPDAPGRTRWDFVLQSAEASVWVVGVRPSGQGFSLNVDSRVDTNRWVEVNGVVRIDHGLVIIDAITLRLAQQPDEAEISAPVARVPTVGPRPEVVFSTPTNEETDVSLNTAVRLQFSRDLDPKSIQGQVGVSYLSQPEPQVAPLSFTTRYDEASRVLELRFPVPLEPFLAVKVELSDRIKATDGAPLVPWSLTFNLGG